VKSISNPLSEGTKAGIGISILVALTLIFTIFFVCLRARRRNLAKQNAADAPMGDFRKAELPNSSVTGPAELSAAKETQEMDWNPKVPGKELDADGTAISEAVGDHGAVEILGDHGAVELLTPYNEVTETQEVAEAKSR
jgi:flagellar biosynthesis/type III secretory pathway M-ring protein FliF/YscJ